MFQTGSQTLKDFNETQIIENIKQWLGDTSPPSPFGIGDDCAVVPSRSLGTVFNLNGRFSLWKAF